MRSVRIFGTLLFVLMLVTQNCKVQNSSAPAPTGTPTFAPPPTSPCDVAYDHMVIDLNCHPYEDAGRGWVDFCNVTAPNPASCVNACTDCACASGCYR